MGGRNLTPREVNDRLCGQALSVCQHLLPGGKQEGQFWIAGSVNGEAGKSLKVHLSGPKCGVWCDYNGGVDKGDMLRLWQSSRNVRFPEALSEAKGFLGIRDEERTFTTPERKARPTLSKPLTVKKADWLADWFKNRGISQRVVDAYRVEADADTIVFPYHAPDGALVMLKYRDRHDKNKIRTNAGAWKCLWGWQAVPDDSREVIICEGEPDAMTWYEQGFPALSVPFGGGAGGKQDWIENEYDNLERFDTIYLSMDMDDSGKAAIPEIVERLGRHRIRVVSLPKKDANDCHLAGLELCQHIAESVTLDPKELRAATEFAEQVWKRFEGGNLSADGTPTPWDEKLKGNLRFRPAEVTIWCGINGHGKSKMLSQVAAFGAKCKTRWCIASMEMKPSDTLYCMYQQAGAINKPTRNFFDAITELFAGRVWLFDVRGHAKTKTIFEVFEYARKKYGIDHFIIDSLAKCGMDEDDYNAQKSFVDRLTDFAAEHTCHIHLVVHSRKREDEAHSPGKMDIKGTGALTDMVDNVLTVWRNKGKEDKINSMDEKIDVPSSLSDQPDAVLTCHKQRHHDWERKIAFTFHPDCHVFTPLKEKPRTLIGDTRDEILNTRSPMAD